MGEVLCVMTTNYNLPSDQVTEGHSESRRESVMRVSVGSPVYWSRGRSQAHLREANVYSHGDRREKPPQQPSYKE